METNWILKSVVSFGAGGVMGLVMGLFMNAMESGRQFDVPGVKQPSTKMLLRVIFFMTSYFIIFFLYIIYV